MDYTGTGNSLNVRHPHVAAADHGLAALLGDRDARRRLPLRPRLDAGAGVLRRRPAVDVLRARAAGPGGQPGQAHRRAVGRRPGRLPGRQLPAAVDGVERQVPRHRARLLARRAGTLGEFASRLAGLVRPLRALRAPARSPVDQLRHRPRRLHPARPRLLQREAQRGQRRGQPATARATTAPGTTASRGRPTTPRCSRCAPGSSATSSRRCCSSRACRCCCTATSSAAPSTATTTPTPGQRAHLGALGPRPTSRCVEFTAARAGCAREHPTFRRKRFFTGDTVRTAATGDRSPTSCGCTPDGGPMERGRLGRRAGRSLGDVPQRPRHPGHRRARRARSRTTTSSCYFNAGDEASSFTLPPEEYAAAWDVVIDTAAARLDDDPHKAPEPLTSSGGACSSVRVPRARAGDRELGRAPPRRAPQADPSRGSRPSARPGVADPCRLPRRPTACRSGGLRPLEAAPTWPTCASSASTGSTSRRCSPESGIDHGYDVVDHSPIDPRAAGGSGLTRAVGGARELGIGVLVDIVPNHVGVARPRENAWWWHVLTPRPRSRRTRPRSTSTGTPRRRIGVRDPGASATTTSRRRARSATCAVGDGELHYHDQRFPLAPGSADRGPEEDADEVHARQHYELVAGGGRTTTSTTAASSPSTPSPRSASRTPSGSTRPTPRSRRWFDEGLVDGLRIDHPDGLRDPGSTSTASPRSPAAPTCWSRRSSSPGRRCPTRGRPPARPGTTRMAHRRPGARRPGRPEAARRPRDPAARAAPSTGTR